MHYTFFVHFFFHDNMKLPINTFYGENVVGVPVRFFSLPRNFILVAAMICVERRRKKKIPDGNSDCLFSFFFIFLSSSFFGYLRQYRHLKYLVEKSLGFVCTGCHNIYPQNVHVLEMRNFHRLTWRWWTYGRTILSESKYLGCSAARALASTHCCGKYRFRSGSLIQWN